MKAQHDESKSTPEQVEATALTTTTRAQPQQCEQLGSTVGIWWWWWFGEGNKKPPEEGE